MQLLGGARRDAERGVVQGSGRQRGAAGRRGWKRCYTATPVPPLDSSPQGFQRLYLILHNKCNIYIYIYVRVRV